MRHRLYWPGQYAKNPNSFYYYLASLNHDNANIQVLLKAFWYNTVRDGYFDLKFTTFKGGTMSSDNNYSFYNAGGTQLDSFTIKCHTFSEDRAGVPLGTLDIDLVNSKSVFTLIN